MSERSERSGRSERKDVKDVTREEAGIVTICPVVPVVADIAHVKSPALFHYAVSIIAALFMFFRHVCQDNTPWFERAFS